jgi:hypothetical protein
MFVVDDATARTSRRSRGRSTRSTAGKTSGSRPKEDVFAEFKTLHGSEPALWENIDASVLQASARLEADPDRDHQ